MSESANENGTPRATPQESATPTKVQANDRVEIPAHGIPVQTSTTVEAVAHRAEEGARRPLPEEMTLGKAADFLDVSSFVLVKLIKRGELPCRGVGKRRRIPSAALVEYRETMFQEARQAADEMAQISQDLGLLGLHDSSYY